MQHFLNISKKKFKKAVWKLSSNGRMVYGYKLMYINEENNIKIEFSIYNEKFKHDILKEHIYKTKLPFY